MQNCEENVRNSEELVAAIQAGATELTLELWNRVSGLVKWKANRVIAAVDQRNGYRGLEFDDLLQTGFVAMAEAVHNFRPEHGSFSTWLMFHLQTAFSETSGFRTKRSRNDPINRAVSLDLPLSDDTDAAALYEVIPDPNAAAAVESVEEKIWQEQLHQALEDALAELPEEYSSILRSHYYQDRTLHEVGTELGIDTQTACQLETKALKKLRNLRNTHRLKPFLDFNYYAGTGLGAYNATGLTVQERYLIRKEERSNRSCADRHL